MTEKKEMLERLSTAVLGMEICQEKVQNVFLLPIRSKKIEIYGLKHAIYQELKIKINKVWQSK